MEKLQQQQFSATLFDESEREILLLLRYSVFPLWKNTHQFTEALKKANMKRIQDALPK